jgi:hypothetical protein
VAISGTRVVVGALQDDAGVSNSGSVYVYDVGGATPTVPVVTLNNPLPASNDLFGTSVAVDGNLLLAGVPFDDTGATNAGSVYVYDLGSVTPAVPLMMLNNPMMLASDLFGGAVAISGTRVLVGASRDDTGATNAGAAYVYDLAGSTPSVPLVTLHNPTPGASDFFGMAVAISGSIMVAGAGPDDTGLPDAGSAYVYDLFDASPALPKFSLNHPGPEVANEFGSSVAVSGTRMVVGSQRKDRGALDAGVAYVYDLSTGAPVLITTLNNPNPEIGDMFGAAVAIYGNRVVVGASADNEGAPNAGAVFVYDLVGTPSSPSMVIHNPDLSSMSGFGSALAISGTRVVVGAEYHSGYSGKAYVFDLNSATPSVPLRTLNNPDAHESDRFGCSVAIDGPVVVVGAFNDNVGTISGAAYVYNLESSGTDAPLLLFNPEMTTFGMFGVAVAVSGETVVVGASRAWTSTEAFVGKAFVFDLSSAIPSEAVLVLNSPTPTANDAFASSLALSGSLLAIRCGDLPVNGKGAVHVYDLAGTSPQAPVATLRNTDGISVDYLGGRLAMDGAMVVVGNAFDDSLSRHAGMCHVFGPHPLDQDSDGLLDVWEQLYWPGATANHGPLDDEDHDGLVNLLELAFGRNPTLPNAGALTPLTQEDGYLTMTITKQPGVAYEVQSAGALTIGQPDSFSSSSTTVLINDATTLKVRDNTLFGTPPARFMRVQVTGAP